MLVLNSHRAAEADCEAAFNNLAICQQQALGCWWEMQKA